MAPLVSIIVPSHLEEPPFLAVTIASVRAQEHTNWEMVVVDDGSGSTALDAMVAVDPRVRLVRAPKRGVGAARNMGLQHVSGDFVAFLDSDDIWYPDHLAGLVGELLSRTTTSSEGQGIERPVVGAWSALDVVEGPEAKLVEPGVARKRNTSLREILRGNERPSINDSLFCRLVVERVGGFDPDLVMAQDVDFIIRVAREGDFASVGRVTGAYRRHQGNSTRDPSRAGIWYDKMIQKNMARAKALNDDEGVRDLRYHRRKARSYYCFASVREAGRSLYRVDVKQAAHITGRALAISPTWTAAGTVKAAARGANSVLSRRRK